MLNFSNCSLATSQIFLIETVWSWRSRDRRTGLLSSVNWIDDTTSGDGGREFYGASRTRETDWVSMPVGADIFLSAPNAVLIL
jgi:hypothetical protein